MKTALIIIDLQNSIVFDQQFILHNSDHVLGNIATVLQKARDSKTPVIFIQHTSKTRAGFIEGSTGWEIHASVKPLPNEIVIQKTVCDSFHETTLYEELKNLKIERVVIVGLRTEMCIDTTSRRAFTLGYKVVLIEDAHSTFDNAVLQAQKIIDHHNVTLSKSFVELRKTADWNF